MTYKLLTENGEYNIGFENNEIDRPLLNAVDTDYKIKGDVTAGFTIEKNGTVYKADLIKADFKEKTFVVKVNGQRVNIQAKDRFDILLSQLGISSVQSKKINQFKSPMPGLIHDILVQEGETIKMGQPLMILEAMKMENILKSPTDAVIKTIKAIKGEAVEKNQLLIEFV